MKITKIECAYHDKRREEIFTMSMKTFVTEYLKYLRKECSLLSKKKYKKVKKMQYDIAQCKKGKGVTMAFAKLGMAAYSRTHDRYDPDMIAATYEAYDASLVSFLKWATGEPIGSIKEIRIYNQWIDVYTEAPN